MIREERDLVLIIPTTMIDYEKQEDFLDELVSWLRSAQSSLRSEELFEDVDDIITEVTYKMKELKE